MGQINLKWILTNVTLEVLTI